MGTTFRLGRVACAIGLLPFRCVAEVPRQEWDERYVRDCLLERENVPVFDEDEEAVDALAELSDASSKRALVLSGDRLVGFLSISDLAWALEARPPRRSRALGRDGRVGRGVPRSH
jgi:CBS domain-containing protein